MSKQRDHINDSTGHVQHVRLRSGNRSVHHLVVEPGFCLWRVIEQLTCHSKVQWKWACLTGLHVATQFCTSEILSIVVDDPNAWLDKLAATNTKESS